MRIAFRPSFVSSLLLALAVAACGSSATGGGDDTIAPSGDDAGGGTDGSSSRNDGGTLPGIDGGARNDGGSNPGTDSGGAFVVAPHPDLPTLQNAGGPILKSPVLIPVVFSTHEWKSQIFDFVSKVVGQDGYWKPNIDEYGVSMPTAGSPITVTEAAPQTIDDSAIQTWLKQKLQDASSGFGTPSENTIYTMFYPRGTTVTMGNGQAKSCESFGGYHQTITVGNTTVPYAVIPLCDPFGPLQGIDAVTGPATHEWLEAATDPQTLNAPAYGQIDDPHYAYRATLGGIEDGDLCAQPPQNFFKPQGFDYMVQRCWSNTAMMAGKDPCVPAIDSMPYFNAGVVANDDVSVFDVLRLGNVQTKGLKIAVGASKTVDVQLFSYAPTAAWEVVAKDMAEIRGGAANMTFAWDKTMGANGDVLKLTVTVNKASSSFLQPNAFLVISKLGTQRQLWPVIVTQ